MHVATIVGWCGRAHVALGAVWVFLQEGIKIRAKNIVRLNLESLQSVRVLCHKQSPHLVHTPSIEWEYLIARL